MGRDEKEEKIEETGQKQFSWDDHFYGAVTVGERGQVVIPASARKRFNIEPGDKLLIMGDPGKRSLMLCKLDALREFMSAFQEGLARVEQDITSGQNGAADAVAAHAPKTEESES
jgi:AbrB family looped-hinge helix DNA binding protein